MTYLCIKPHCPTTCDGCNHAVPSESNALLADSLDRMRSQTAWLRNGTLDKPPKTMAVHHMEAVLAHVAALEKQVHDLNWALGTEGYEKMHDPADQAEHEEAVRGTERFVERMRLATARQEALQADAESYRWLREQQMSDGTLCVVRPADLRLGLLAVNVQNFAGQALDDAIKVRRLPNPTPLP